MSRILVVDDEPDLCEILAFNLRMEGFEVDTASSAEEALALLAEGKRYELLLLDVMLGGMSGFDLARELRVADDGTPIIFLTARDGHDDQLRGFSLGADDYVAKPFTADTLLARVRAVLRRSAAAHVPVSQGEVPIGLTRREYLIYRLLKENPGRFFSRSEILAAVWPDDTCVSERSVDVHIARLRKKLGSEGLQVVNKTGFGYGMV